MNPPEMKEIIINEVCAFYGLTPDQLTSKSREGKIPEARAVCADVLYDMFTQNKCEISRILGQSKKWANLTLKQDTSRIENNKMYCGRKVVETLQTIENTKHTKIAELVCKEYGITDHVLKSKSREGVTPNARASYVYLLFKHVTDNKNTLAKLMGRRSHSSVIRILNNAEGLISINDRKFISHLKSIEDGIPG